MDKFCIGNSLPLVLSRRRYSQDEFHSWEFACSKGRRWKEETSSWTRDLSSLLSLFLFLPLPLPLPLFLSRCVSQAYFRAAPSLDIDFSSSACISEYSTFISYLHTKHTFFFLRNTLNAYNDDCESIYLDKVKWRYSASWSQITI